MPGIPFFRPQFPAVTLRCNLCGKAKEPGNPTIGDQSFITERARSIMDCETGGDFNFCRSCHPIAAEVGQLCENFRAECYAEAESKIAAEMPALVERWIAERQPGAPKPTVPETATVKRVRTRGMIPEPVRAHG